MVCKVCEVTESIKWYKQGTECRSCFYKAYTRANRQKMNELRKVWMAKNPNKEQEYKSQFQTEHRAKYLKIHRHGENKRRAIKLSALPSWVDIKSIKEIYDNCPEGYHVDHIVPLINENVCGLHVPCNLQYLPAIENLKKGNSFNSESGIL